MGRSPGSAKQCFIRQAIPHPECCSLLLALRRFTKEIRKLEQSGHLEAENLEKGAEPGMERLVRLPLHRREERYPHTHSYQGTMYLASFPSWLMGCISTAFEVIVYCRHFCLLAHPCQRLMNTQKVRRGEAFIEGLLQVVWMRGYVACRATKLSTAPRDSSAE